MTDAVLALDLGTSAVKALLISREGTILGTGSAEHPTAHPRPGYAEQNPDDWWRATVTATRQALNGYQGGVAAIGLTGQMHGTVLLDTAGHALGPAIIWADGRSGTQVAELTERVGRERLIKLTGSPLAVGFQAATARWLQMHEPRRWHQVRHVLLPKDELRRRLTGEFATDPSDGSGTLLLDVHLRDWSPDVLVAAGIDRALLPPVIASTAITGELLSEPAAELGLPAGLPVVAGAGDAPAAALGAGVITPNQLLLTLSTGAQVLVPTETVRGDRHGRLHTFCAALAPGSTGAAWYQMGATLTAGLALRWLRDQIFGLTGPDAYERLLDWAEQAAPGAGGLLFLPYLIGERTPHMDPSARGLLLGLTAAHGRTELVRAVLEGTIFACYDAYQALTETGARPERIILAGGGARGRLWRQIVADVFNLPVATLASADQSAIGAAILAAAGTERTDPATIAQAWEVYDTSMEPDAARHRHYVALFDLFQAAYRKHRDDFPRLAALGEEGASER